MVARKPTLKVTVSRAILCAVCRRPFGPDVEGVMWEASDGAVGEVAQMFGLV